MLCRNDGVVNCRNQAIKRFERRPLSAKAIFHQSTTCAALGLESGADDCVADASEAKPPETQWNKTLVRKVSAEATASE
jgi:hypothetical protein